jgi:MFS superfamily sulfate permease-like transporter
MLWLAVTTLEKLKQIPARFWINALLAVATLAVVIVLARYAARMNRFMLAIIVFLLVTVVSFQWVYERNEPKFLSSTIDKIAPFFPKKIQYKEYDAPK